MESYFLCLPNHNYFKRWWASVTNIFKLNEQISNQLGGKGKPALILLYYLADVILQTQWIP